MKIFNKSCTTLICLLAAAARAQDVTAMLAAADKFRQSADKLQVEMRIQVHNADGTPDKERLYTVFAQGARQSLVLMRSPADAGQKVLMLGDDFWLLMPASQRPLRITPMQKLLGDASTGDVASMRWAEDFDAKLVGEEPCENTGAGTAQRCWHLNLTAAHKGVSYQRIELWLGKARHEPVRADLYVLSEKLAKQARFVLDRPGGQVVAEMVLTDQLSNHKTTYVHYLSRKERQVPKTWLNPMFLVKTPHLE